MQSGGSAKWDSPIGKQSDIHLPYSPNVCSRETKTEAINEYVHNIFHNHPKLAACPSAREQTNGPWYTHVLRPRRHHRSQRGHTRCPGWSPNYCQAKGALLRRLHTTGFHLCDILGDASGDREQHGDDASMGTGASPGPPGAGVRCCSAWRMSGSWRVF